jgi:SAM-dependent methyltransferase/ADP-heptose:LPS heptosyltransferase
MPKRLILRNFQSPGDIVMLTAAVRDLHARYPGEFVTDVRTACPALWENNPYITPLEERDPDAELIHCDYPLIHRSNQEPYHFVHAFCAFLSRRLDLDIRPTEFKGDIHISNLEKSWFSQVEQIVGASVPFWILVSGGKNDFTIKWWDWRRYQQVVDHFRGRILFVLVGEKSHVHPPLQGVLDLRGQTDLRQLVRLVYHSQGTLGPVSLLMHLAAAVEMKAEYRVQHRATVVVAGGREPTHWEAYPHHQFIHTLGALRCCDAGGCWKSRTLPLGDGDEKDRPENLCVDVVGTLPRCMDMITAAEVARRIEMYFDGGALKYLTEAQHAQVSAAIAGMTGERGEHRLFKPRSLQEGIEGVVGECNGVPAAERWEKETPVFAREIARLAPADRPTILDYGCGVGRLAKAVLAAHPTAKVIGVDESSESLGLAREYVANDRFVAKLPGDLSEDIDLAYCIYVLQHVPAIQIREVLQRIHRHLKADGLFVYCSSDYRMAIRFDQPGFEDDRWLGVNLRREVARYFEPVGDLFSPDILEASPVVRQMVAPVDGGLAHPALVFRKRRLDGLPNP